MKKQTGFKFESFVIKEAYIKRNPVKQGKFKFSIDPIGKIDSENSKFYLELIVELSDDTDSFEAEVHAIGSFKFAGNNDEMLSNFFIINAPAIIFPYIRSYISTLTANSGLKTINLPVMNLTSIGKKLKNNIEEI